MERAPVLIRVRRKRGAEPAEALLLAVKKRRGNTNGEIFKTGIRVTLLENNVLHYVTALR